MSDTEKIVQELERALLDENKVGLVLQQLQYRTGLSREKTKFALRELLDENVIIESNLTINESESRPSRKIYSLKEGLKEINKNQVKKQIFLSYAREDIHSVERLNQDLTSKGFKVWFDKEKLLPGQDWKATISQTINESRFFLAVLSRNSVNKRGFVQSEVAEALDVLKEYPPTKIFIIPVRLDECEPSHKKLKELQWADMFPTWEEGLEKVISAIRTHQESTNSSIISRKISTEAVEKNKNSSNGSPRVILDDFNSDAEAIETQTEYTEFVLIDRKPTASSLPVTIFASSDENLRGCKYAKIQTAIDACKPGDTITIEAGVYKENICINRSAKIKGEGRIEPS